ncbi:hypothetical protein LCGC14_0282870 [marine sediment metagenome]|uniref:Uncharacterized protein n=1 Tax=marine sediment metagenome TaxID=412755 RepID=A0A0F9X123_9ZZZZ
MRGLEWIGAIAGIAGAMMIASNTGLSPYGWIGFAISSSTLAVFSYNLKAWGLLSLQICFCATNAVGLWRWLIEPVISAGAGA